ncbi:integrase core domain-containing protein [Lactiplantibacillus plantarum]|uniref:integrase core domain-containing protein n=1 Tax=Lactiplantibacillus plantarum TaxID=1590 RepID=UPI0035C67193
MVTSFYRTQARSLFLFSYLLHFNCKFVHQKPQYFHSDMGSQYTSNEVETLLERHQISHSYSKQGYPYDNGPIEAFHSLLKREFAFQTTFSNFEDLVIRTSNYISWFNSDRIRTSV